MKVGMHRLLAAVAVSIQLLIVSPTAFADAEPVGYRAAVDEAISEFAAHRFDEARTLFARAHALFPNARTLRGLGLVEFELRDYVTCVQHLDAALSSDVRPLQDELRAETESLRMRAAGFIGVLTLHSRPQAVRLLVDGEPAASPNQPLLLSLGTHTLELFANGYEPERRSLQIAGGEERTLVVDFSRSSVPRNAHDTRAASTSWYQSPWLWIAAAGVVVAGAAVGVALATKPDQSPAFSSGTSGVVIQSL